MAIAQMSALSGRKKPKEDYVSQINAQAMYLPNLYAQKKQDLYQQQLYDLEKQNLELYQKELDLAAKNQEKNLSLQEKAQKEAKKQAKKAEMMGYANLGIQGGLGLAGLYSTFAKPEQSFQSGVGADLIGTVDFGDVAGLGPGTLTSMQSFSPSAIPDTSGITGFSGFAGLGSSGGLLSDIGSSFLEAGRSFYDVAIKPVVDFFF